MPHSDLYKFLSDPNLVNLMERVKISDDFLDVISLSETQHSDMLAWCLHPNEGHAQGDAVIKDFLTAAYNAGAETNKYSNKTFFAKWTPGRVRTASFGSAFIAREFSLVADEANKRRRLDLFLIDPSNKIVITIENKAGASLTEDQLNTYYDQVNEKISKRRVFKDYDFAYIVVDRALNEYAESHLDSLGNKWALLDYSWLEASANRARHHLERNNEAAQLLMAYCQKQTGWQSPNEKQVSELSAELASHHEPVVDMIRRVRKVQPTEWTPSSFEGEHGELLLFIQQNRQLCDHLIQARGIGAVLVGLRKNMPTLPHSHVEHGRTWARFTTETMLTLARSKDDYWPIFINIFKETKNDDENSKFTIRMCWVAESFNEKCDVEKLRQRFAERFPDLKKFEGSTIRRVVASRKLDPGTAVRTAVELAGEIDTIIKQARTSGICT